MRTAARSGVEAPAAPRGLPVRAVSDAVSFRGAAQAVVDHLSEAGLMPSVYLEVDGRLRCQAVRGYWQIFDGMPPGAGIIGQTHRTGTEHVRADVARDPVYLTAVPAVRAEACVPLWVHGRVAGVLNAESTTAIGADALDEVRGCAGLLERHLESHRSDPPAAAQRLARRAARLANLTSGDDIVAEAVDSACWVSGFSSAVLVLTDARGELHVCGSAGPFGRVFAGLHPVELARMDGWVAHGTSSYTVGEPSGAGFAGHESLRAAGARSLMVLPLEASGRRLGFLALADDVARSLCTDDAELIELLATQVAAGLRVAGAVAELRRRASTDPLTGLGHHASFHEALTAAFDGGGKVAVLLADLDGFKTLNDSQGHRTGDAVLRAAAALLREKLPPEAGAYRIGGDEFALLFFDGGGAAARQVAEAVRAAARDALGLTMSIGVAQAAPGETEGELMERVDAALYEVKRRGRDGVEVAARVLPAPAWQVRLF